MDQVYLNSVKSISSNKKWVGIDVSGRSFHTLEYKEAAVKFKIFNEHDCVAHHLKRMNLIDCVIKISSLTKKIYSSAVHSVENDKQKIFPACTGKHEEKWCKIQNPSH